MSDDSGRSILLTVDWLPDLDARVAEWLESRSLDAIYATATLASPVRDGGVAEQVLALDGLSAGETGELVADLGLKLIVEPFQSRR